MGSTPPIQSEKEFSLFTFSLRKHFCFLGAKWKKHTFTSHWLYISNPDWKRTNQHQGTNDIIAKCHQFQDVLRVREVTRSSTRCPCTLDCSLWGIRLVPWIMVLLHVAAWEQVQQPRGDAHGKQKQWRRNARFQFR